MQTREALPPGSAWNWLMEGVEDEMPKMRVSLPSGSRLTVVQRRLRNRESIHIRAITPKNGDM